MEESMKNFTFKQQKIKTNLACPTLTSIPGSNRPPVKFDLSAPVTKNIPL